MLPRGTHDSSDGSHIDFLEFRPHEPVQPAFGWGLRIRLGGFGPLVVLIDAQLNVDDDLGDTVHDWRLWAR